MLRKYNQAVNGPSWAEVIFGAILSVALGVVLGALLLVIRPAEAVKQMPKEADIDPKKIYYVLGSRDYTKAKEVAAKRKAFVEGQSVTVYEDHLNALFPVKPPVAKAPAPAPKPVTTTKQGEKAKTPDKAGAPDAPAEETLVIESPDFRINDSAFQIAVPITVSFLGLSQTVVAQSRGKFVRQGDVFVYDPSEVFVGSCPVHLLPYAAEYAREKFLSIPVPDDIKGAWSKLANVSLEGKMLKLTVP